MSIPLTFYTRMGLIDEVNVKGRHGFVPIVTAVAFFTAFTFFTAAMFVAVIAYNYVIYFFTLVMCYYICYNCYAVTSFTLQLKLNYW